ncbi:MAG: hypothetical protein COA49_02755 [Bacteroidetes bacterium]|nr:MAG: hypothetical protein COA49_02755 [Bacteroidota bacterium]
MKGANYLFLFLCLFALPLSLSAQQNGNWLMYFGTNRISETLSIHTEIQHRNNTIAPVNLEQLLLRTGLNYHFSDKAFVTAGYGYITNYDIEGSLEGPESKEHRVWQQFILNNKIGRVKFEHRYRIEQRWVNLNYKARFRYRLMLLLPINKPQIETGTLFIGVYDEVFINSKSTFFDRNRLYGALGYQFSSTIGVQLGVLFQQVSDFGKCYFQCGVTYNPDFSNRE